MAKKSGPRFDATKLPRLRQVLDALGYGEVKPPPYARYAAKGEGVRITLYESGKLLVQGKRAAQVQTELDAFGLLPGGAGPAGITADKLAAAAAPAKGKASRARPSAVAPVADEPPTIGSDEAGKGDYFGRLVVAACFVSPADAKYLREIGVMDSKRLTDPRAHALAGKIRKRLKHEIVAMRPETYNRMYERFSNLNRMLAWAHAQAIRKVLEKTEGCERVIIDQFARSEQVMLRALGDATKDVEVVQRPRGEEEIAVAAASILARSGFLNTLSDLSEAFEIELPKGAAPKVDAAGRAFVKKHGAARLGEVAKLHFKTTGRVLG